MISSNVIGDRSILGQFVCCILYIHTHYSTVDLLTVTNTHLFQFLW